MIRASTRVTTNKDAAGAVDQGVRDALMDAAGTGFEVSQQRVPVDRGKLLQSGFPPREAPDGSIQWGYTAKHAKPIEEGTLPFTPPLQPLLDWGRRVGAPGAAVWQKIRKEGIDAQPYVQPGVDAMKAKLRARGISHYISEVL